MSRKERSQPKRRSTRMPDFDVMVELAMNDPEAFEAKRQDIINAFLDTVPDENRRRLVGLQWQIDQVRSLAKTPMAACISISNMMRESLSKLHFYQRELVKMNPLDPNYERSALPDPIPAKILPFKGNSTRH